MFKDIKAIKGKYYIQRLIDEGEHEQQDFKFQISDVHKIAHSISAFSNNRGGRLLVGVKDNGNIAGLRNEEDLYLLQAAAEIYCRPAVQLEMTTFACEGGAIVLRAVIPPAPTRPVRCKQPDGTWQAYYRVADENILAHPLMVRAWMHEAEAAADPSRAPLLSLSPTETAILGHLASCRRATVEELTRVAHLSASTASTVIVRLLAMHIITFVHTPAGFHIELQSS